ncbi:MAG: multicopper oxidase family protein [Desulfobulbus sp.]|nr:MAG: multicopper oxidase family protein [Desulfobulbus sp.]
MGATLGGFLAMLAPLPGYAAINVQCPGDTNGSATWDAGEVQPPNTKCMHLGAGDGFITMADGATQYIFGFSDLTGLVTKPVPPDTGDDVMMEGMLGASFPAPPIMLDEGDEFYLTLTNVGMMMRPDLFDPHSVHYHGFPEAAPIFDGVPDASISINMGSSLTYYYKINDPGTYMYHCHVEATEHMQMGMLGNLYVRPVQDGTTYTYGGRDYTKFAYNDGDGSTGYDKDYPIQIGSMDSAFHNASLTVQPLPFALMEDDYPMLNGRGYPDTVNPAALPPPAGNVNGGKASQKESSLIEAAPGERVLLRISNLNVTRFYTLATLGVDMTVVGMNAKLLRGPDGKDLYYKTNSVTLGGGESVDAIIEIPVDAAAGTKYFLYTTNLNYLSNNTEPFGGMMTEIRVN